MSNIFLDIQNALASVTGLDVTVAGFVLGATLIIALIIILHLVIGDESSDTFLISAGLGILIAGVVGWFPLWSIVFFALILLFVVVDPMGNRSAD